MRGVALLATLDRYRDSKRRDREVVAPEAQGQCAGEESDDA